MTAVVTGDLRWLRDADLNTADETVLRELSARLRKLLIDNGGTLQRLRKAMGLRGEPRVSAVEIPSGMTGPDVLFAQAGGMERGGTRVAHTAIVNRPMSPEEVKARYEAMKDGPPIVERTLSNWLSHGCMRVDRVVVTRRDVIKFVANKLGGVHFDTSRNDPGYVALDKARESHTVLDLDPVYAQLTATGQQLWASPDIQALLV